MIDFESKYTGAEVEQILDSVEDKYTKPSTGIPASDLAPDVFLQGEKGDKGDKGDTGATGPQGVSVTTVAQTTTSSADGGSNVVTVTLSDGKTSTFTVKNGSKGSQGIQGPKGDTGEAGTNGTNGVSVSSVKQTTTSTADGGNNVVTVTLSNGTTSTFNVKNGSKGSNGTNGTNGKDGEDGATFIPSVDSAGNLSWTNDKGLPNPATINIKGPKGDSGDSGGGAGTIENPFIVISDSYCEIPPNTTVIFNEKHWFYEIGFELSSSNSFCDEFRAIFTTPFDGSELTIYGSLKWINGEPVINGDTTYELSVLIYKYGFGHNAQGLAVLTPFE